MATELPAPWLGLAFDPPRPHAAILAKYWHGMPDPRPAPPSTMRTPADIERYLVAKLEQRVGPWFWTPDRGLFVRVLAMEERPWGPDEAECETAVCVDPTEDAYIAGTITPGGEMAVVCEGTFGSFGQVVGELSERYARLYASRAAFRQVCW